jgi:hypothetical protein
VALPIRRARRIDRGKLRWRLRQAGQWGTAVIGDHVAECFYLVDGGTWRRALVLGVRPVPDADNSLSIGPASEPAQVGIVEAGPLPI